MVSREEENRSDTACPTLYARQHSHTYTLTYIHTHNPAGVAVANASFRTLAVGELEDTSELKALEALAVQVGKEGGREEGGRTGLRCEISCSRFPHAYTYRWVPRSAWCFAERRRQGPRAGGRRRTTSANPSWTS